MRKLFRLVIGEAEDVVLAAARTADSREAPFGQTHRAREHSKRALSFRFENRELRACRAQGTLALASFGQFPLADWIGCPVTFGYELGIRLKKGLWEKERGGV